MIEVARITELMHLAISEAAKSQPEDDGVHPKVGAVLTSEDGAVLQQAHRGERGHGDHAEYICLSKAGEAGQDPRDGIMFVTLEPCTAPRGKDKTPCAKHLIQAGVRKVFIGMLDPNLVICGHGETRLRFDMDVERFPGELVRQIEELNADFVALYRNSHLSRTAIYVRLRIPELIRENLARRGIVFDDLPVGGNVTAADLVAFCRALLPNAAHTPAHLERFIQEARGYAFDKKYAALTYEDDTRGLGDHWRRELLSILASMGAADYKRRRLLVVGIGNGEEGEELYSGCSNLHAVDIAPLSLEAARHRIAGGRFSLAAAEDLNAISSGGIDVYVSLRTYQSSYFDRHAAIREAYRVVRQGGIVIVSIANGFLDQGALIPGLLIPGTTIVNRDEAFLLANEVRSKLAALGFDDIGVRTSIDEVFVFGRRGR